MTVRRIRRTPVVEITPAKRKRKSRAKSTEVVEDARRVRRIGTIQDPDSIPVIVFPGEVLEERTRREVAPEHDAREPWSDHVTHSSNRMDWGTPEWLFDYYDSEYDFDIDLAASYENTLCADYWDEEENALEQDWGDRTCWLNPPYGRGIGNWMRKCVLSPQAWVVALVPARTDTRWFDEWVWPYANRIDLIHGRITFDGATSGAPFPSMVVHYSRPLRPNRRPRMRSDGLRIQRLATQVGPVFRRLYPRQMRERE